MNKKVSVHELQKSEPHGLRDLDARDNFHSGITRKRLEQRLRGQYKFIVGVWHIFLILSNNCYGIVNNVWKFQVSTMKIVPVAPI